MGTRFELVLPGSPTDPDLRAAGEAALEEITGSHARLNRFDPASLVRHLATLPAGATVPLDADTFALFLDVTRVFDASDGAFDPSLDGGMADLQLDPASQTLTVSRPGIALDLGAVAKGHALDLAARALRAAGIGCAFLHGGTSSALAIGTPPPPAEPAWRVGLGPADAVELRDEALSLSGAWEGNPHPTVDPRTGDPIPAPRRTLVTGPSARLADAWSTALLVLGRVPAGFPSGYHPRILIV